jgi:ADP-heptose:LPS heptosyltransferase
MQKILFITSTRIGDAVLSTGLLNHVIKAHPDCQITVACGPLVSGFFEAVPNVTRVIALKKEKRAGHWRKLWKEAIKTRWDMVIDLRNSAVSRLIFAKKRYIFGGHIDAKLHKAEQNAAVMKLLQVPDLKLWFSDENLQKAKQALGTQNDIRPIIAVGPAANWIAKTWPSERFIKLLSEITNPESENCLIPNARIAVIAAPGEEEQAKPVLESIPEGRRIDLIAKGRPEFGAACISLCDLYIGNDSGLMHCAAAAGIPTFGLFGPSWPHLYSPWGEKTAFISTPEDFAQLINYEGYAPQTAPCLMNSLETDDVLKALKNFWNNL